MKTFGLTPPNIHHPRLTGAGFDTPCFNEGMIRNAQKDYQKLLEKARDTQH